MFKNILIPLDGSELAERVIAAVAPWRAAEATLHLVRVIPGAGKTPTPFEEAQTIEAESYLAFLAGRLDGRTKTWVRRGESAAEILVAAEKVGADLIALSSHGESGIGKVVFGSVAERIVRTTSCPVFVVGNRTEVPAVAAKPSCIMIAVDGTPGSETVLKAARELARRPGVKAVLLSVVESLWAAVDSAMARTQAKEVRKTADRLEKLAIDLRADGVDAASLLVRGDPTGEILAQVKRRKADLLCMSMLVRGAVGRWVFGSTTESVLASSPVPVLVVRKGEPKD